MITAITVVAAATVLPAASARADIAFRKTTPAATDSTSSEVEPIRGERAVAQAADAPASDDEAPPPAKKEEYVPQAEDKDRPHDPSLLDQNTAEAQLKAKAKKNKEVPIYEKWQFWAITGGAVVVLVGAIIGGFAIAHQINGGDIRPCGMAFETACFGQGR